MAFYVFQIDLLSAALLRTGYKKGHLSLNVCISPESQNSHPLICPEFLTYIYCHQIVRKQDTTKNIDGDTGRLKNERKGVRGLQRKERR